ncbi:MAG TPA: penicillin acylase family protein [Solirubrobacteraceae bacterium]|nr:penicillin acylase family protein [Solirubrobacteraceae bacterium]
MSRSPLRAATATLAALLLLAAPAAARDYAETALNIIPSNQPGAVPVPAGADAQTRMYDGLTPLFDNVTDDDLGRFFKSSKFGVGPDGPARTETVPRRGVTIVRDRFDVPHIKGRTRADVVWAMGWVIVEDRGLLLQFGRNPGRLAALDAPNIDAFGLVTGLRAYTPTAQANRIINRTQTRALRRRGREGRAILRDIDLFAAGMNARLRFERSDQPRITRTDIFGFIALAGQIFGEGGGREARNAELYDGLRDRLGEQPALDLLDDLSNVDDPDSPATISASFPQGRAGTSRAGNEVIDAGSLQLVQPTPATRAAERLQAPTASNFLILDGRRSTNGHPLFVGGPQIGYFYPGLTLEADLEWPGHQVRGIYSPAHPGVVFIGRAEDFAWSLTSAGTDNVDTFVETLCGSDTRYRYKGRCRTMGAVDAGVIEGQGRVRYRTTVHGPVIGYATVDGRRVALSTKRSSYGRDALWMSGFRRANLGRIRSAADMFRAFGDSPYTFNVGYADDRQIAMYSAGRLPRRHPQVDPRFPTKGTGEYEWRGFLSQRRHAQQIGHPTGALLNWNNRPAANWGAADDNWSYGSAHRNDMLAAGIAKREKHDLASVTAAMNAAATQDLRSFALTPKLSALLRGGGAAPSPRAQRMLELLEAWHAAGSSNLDRDEDGFVDAGAGPAVMYGLYPRLVDAVMGGPLGPQLGEFKQLVGSVGSNFHGFSGAAITHLDKVLGSLTGEQLRSPYKTQFCGDAAACRERIWAAFEATAAALEAEQGTPDPDAWRARSERIRFAPGVLSTTIRWTNRPSGIQVLATFDGHRP